MSIKFEDQSQAIIDVASEIDIKYMYNKHPARGYQCAYTEGMEQYGCPELCLMDYYDPDRASYILINMADCILNGEVFDSEQEAYDFFNLITLTDERGEDSMTFGFIGGDLYGEPVMVLQLLEEESLTPIHPGGESLPSWTKRGFEPWCMFMYTDGEDEQEQEDDE